VLLCVIAVVMRAKLLNILELVVEAANSDTIEITDEMVENRLQQNPLAYDKDGEMHYDIISAFIKSIRGSDPMRSLLDGAHDRRRRRPAVYRPPAGHQCG
jgi:replication-associated recombination protein RarA